MLRLQIVKGHKTKRISGIIALADPSLNAALLKLNPSVLDAHLLKIAT